MSPEPQAMPRSTSVAVANLPQPYGTAGRGSSSGPEPGVPGIAAEIAGVLTGELDRYYDEWRRLFSTMHETLSPLSRLCETASERRQPSVPALSALLEQLTAAAASQAEAAAAQAAAAAETIVADQQAALGRLESELRRARDTLQVTTETLERERTAWAETRTGLEQARSDEQQTAAACRAELREAREELETTCAEFAIVAQQLETERSERLKLEAALEAVQRALRFPESRAATTPSGDVRDGGSTVAPAPVADRSSADDDGQASVTDETGPPLAVSPALALVHNQQPARAEADPELDEYACELLVVAESAYWADLASSVPVVAADRLTENLRQARERFLSRSTTPTSDDLTLFKRHLMSLLESRWETSFGRHLGIAIYQLYPTLGEGQLRSRAS